MARMYSDGSQNNVSLLSVEAVQRITLIFGIVYFLVGIMGFIPGVTTVAPGSPDIYTNGLELGIFGVNWLHDVAHLLLGAVLIWGGVSRTMVRPVNQALAVVFLLLTVSAFIQPLVDGMALNTPDLFLHLASTLLTGFLGFIALRNNPNTGVESH